MVRNRFLRIERGRILTQEGKSKNRCGQCGQLKRGHVCQAPRQLVSTSLQAQEARHEALRLTAAALPAPAFDIMGGGSPMMVVEGEPGTSSGAGAPALGRQCSMQLLLQATEMKQYDEPGDAELDAPFYENIGVGDPVGAYCLPVAAESKPVLDSAFGSALVVDDAGERASTYRSMGSAGAPESASAYRSLHSVGAMASDCIPGGDAISQDSIGSAEEVVV